MLEFAGGAVGTLLATTAAYPGYARRIEITGTEGTVILEHDRVIAADFRNSLPEIITASGDVNQSASSASVTDITGHKAVIENFLHAIANNAPLACDGTEGRRSLALVEAIYRAAQQPDRAFTP